MVVVVAHSSKCFSGDMVLNFIILFVMKYLYLGIIFGETFPSNIALKIV
jgi:hypothetical protein